jgi:hypothetical protein
MGGRQKREGRRAEKSVKREGKEEKGESNPENSSFKVALCESYWRKHVSASSLPSGLNGFHDLGKGHHAFSCSDFALSLSPCW